MFLAYEMDSHNDKTQTEFMIHGYALCQLFLHCSGFRTKLNVNSILVLMIRLGNHFIAKYIF